MTGCSREGVRQNTHDSLTIVLHNILRMYGIHARREVCPFKETHPKSKKRLDIVISEGQLGCEKKMLLDVTVTNPINVHTRAGRGHQDAASNAAYNTKIKKYGALAEAVNCVVKPVVFESTGRIHTETVKLFKRIAGVEGSDVCSDSKNLYRYWMRIVSVTLQKGLAKAFLTGRRRLMSDNFIVPPQYSQYTANCYNDLHIMNGSSNDE